MFEFVGKDALNGALKRFSELLLGANLESINSSLETLAGKVPILNMLVDGYNAMSDEEKATFAKNLMIAAASIAAKSGGKVTF